MVKYVLTHHVVVIPYNAMAGKASDATRGRARCPANQPSTFTNAMLILALNASLMPASLEQPHHRLPSPHF
eukprot:scaffold325237_cov15-Prasinocladus_malaysianus.AAC.1